MAETNPSVSTKRPRAETESAGSDAPAASVTPASARAVRPPPTKRSKPEDAPASDFEDGDLEEPLQDLNSDTDPASDDDDDEGGLVSLAKRTKQAVGATGSSGSLKASGKRARFLIRWAGHTPEETLEGLIGIWWSSYYDHFQKPKLLRVTKPDGTVAYMHRFICKRYPSKHVDRSDYEDSTGNLIRHVSSCDPADVPEGELISAYAHGVTYTPARLRFLLAMWCARRHRPFRLIEDPELCEILHMLYDKVDIPSRWTISRDIRLLHVDARTRVVIYLLALGGKIHLCVDGWTSPNVISFLGITAHWVLDGRVRHIILDFIRLDSAHTGAYLAEKMAQCLIEYGIEKKVLAVTCDNAENNSTMMTKLEAILPTIRGSKVRVRCLAHILNLVVKAILSQFDTDRRRRRSQEAAADAQGEDAELVALEDDRDFAEEEPEAEEDEEEDAQEPDEARDAADEAVIDKYEDENKDSEITPKEVRDGHMALKKITELSKKVWHSPTVRAELARLATEAELPCSVLVRPVRTRWNTMTEVLKRALDMREVLGHLCDLMAFNKPQGVRLRRFALTDEEWEIVKQLYDLLEPFLYATNEISKSGHALVHEVIPYIDLLTDHVDDVDKDTQLAPAVRAAAKRGRAILDKYYSYTDDSVIYRIAMILNPRYKREYFHLREWPTEWVNEAVKIARDEWQTYYKPKPAAHPPAPRPAGRRSAQGSVDSTSSASNQASAPSTSGGQRIFASISRAGRAGANIDAFEAYLEEPPSSSVDDPLAHWEIVLASASATDSPRAVERQALARMALDFLSIPAASTDAERAFSRGGLTVSKYRHSLTDESVRASTLLGSWANIPELVPEGDTIAKLKSISRKKEPTSEPSATASGSAGPQDPVPADARKATTVEKGKGKATAAEKGKGKASAPAGKGMHKSGSSTHGKGGRQVEVIELE
ncbi:hypothetical protein VTO73DRAFT_7544 [Trametes versicolor]